MRQLRTNKFPPEDCTAVTVWSKEQWSAAIDDIDAPPKDVTDSPKKLDD